MSGDSSTDAQNGAHSLSSVFMIKAIIVGTVFVNLKDVTSGFYSRSGVLFLYVLILPIFPYRGSSLLVLFSSRLSQH